MTALLLPVLKIRNLRAWPKHAQGGAATYQPAAVALRQRYATDAHTAGYSAHSIARRLDKDAPEQMPGGVAMVALFVDVDTPNHVPATDAWREQERTKIAAALAALPGGFAFESRGGYKLVWRLPEPFTITSAADYARWRLFYWRTLLALSRRFGIEGDPSCADWTRLYRLPHATRDEGGKPEDLPTEGDPELRHPLALDLEAAELEADLAEARRLEAAHNEWKSAVKALSLEAGEREPAQASPPPYASGPWPSSKSSSATRERRERMWAEKALERMAGELAATTRGVRNNAARDAALVLGHYAPHLLDPSAIEHALLAACERNGLVHDDGRDAALTTIRRAISDGMKTPKHPNVSDDRTRDPEVVRDAFRKAKAKRQAQGQRPSAEESRMHEHEHANGQEGEDAPASGPRPAPCDERPEVRMGADLPGHIDAAVKALASYPNLYTRALSLAQIVDTADPESADKKGGPVLRALPRPTLREILVKVASWKRFEPRSGGWKEAIPTDAIVQGVEARGYWPELRPIVGIVQTPFLRRDGSACTEPGYDEATGFALVCREAFPPIPEAPTQEDARRALASILDLFCDFPFIDEAARHVPVAALLTMLAMPALGGANTPAFLFEANTPGTGKGLTLDTVCILATGREVPKSPWAHDEEMAKVLGAAALEGAGVLAFDNISPEIPFGGSAIELVLTCSGQYKPRILGRSEAPTLPWRAIVMGTGNNIVVRGDTRRRVLLCTQRSELENPESRENFKYPHLRHEARTRRGELVTAALTILRAHALVGRPAAGVTRLGSFEEWGAIVASAITWAGGANVTAAMPRNNTSDDPVLSALGVLLEAWPLFDPVGAGLRLGALADKLYPSPPQEPSDDGLGHVREALELLAPQRGGGRVRFDVRRLGYVLRAHRGRNLGGRAFEEGPVNHGAKTWRVIDPRTGHGVHHGGGSGGSGGSSTSDAGAPRAHERERGHAHAYAGSAPDGPPTSPTSPTSPTTTPEQRSGSPTPPPVSGVTSSAPDKGDGYSIGPDGLGTIEA